MTPAVCAIASIIIIFVNLIGGVVVGTMQMGMTTSEALNRFALLTIGDGACLGTFVNLENARVEGGRLIIGRIVIGRDAAVDSYAVLENDTSVGDGARLAGQSALAESKHIPAGETWGGTPAQPIRNWLRETAMLSRMAKEKKKDRP